MYVYVVMLEDEFGESSQIHGVYSSEELANNEVKNITSHLDSMIALVETHEVQDES